MARMTEPVIKSTATGKWHGQYSAKEYSPSEVEMKGGEHWSKTHPEVDAIVHENPCSKHGGGKY